MNLSQLIPLNSSVVMNGQTTAPCSDQIPRIGFNHNVAHHGRRYHVQTEDLGPEKGSIFSHVFFDGQVIASRKVQYRSVREGGTPAADILQLMKDSHKAMIRGLCRGSLDAKIRQYLSDPLEPLDGTREPAVDAPEPPQTPTEHSTTNARQTRLKETINMGNVQSALDKLNTDVTGILGAAVVDHESGMCLGTIGNGIDLEVAAAGNTEVVRSKMRVMRELGIEGSIEDILISLRDQYHIIRPLEGKLFMYLAIDRSKGNLAMARHQLARVGSEVVL